VHPQAEKESIFGVFLVGGDIGSVEVVNSAVLAYDFRATTEKRVNFL